jgi:hypothetical protein
MKEVTNVEREMRQNHKFALKREVVDIECDDGSEYIFERVPERKREAFRLVRRVKPDGAISTSKRALPEAVKETVETVTEGWYK